MICQHTTSLGLYLLGAMEPAERFGFEDHLATCATCRRELVRLAPLPGLLHQLRAEDFEELVADDAKPATPWSQLLPLRPVAAAEVEQVPPTFPDRPARDERGPHGVPHSVPHDVPQGDPRGASLGQQDGQQNNGNDGDGEAASRAGTADTGEGPTDGTVARLPRTPRQRRRARTYWLTAAAAGVVLVLVVGAIAVFGRPSQPQWSTAEPVTWSATDGHTGVHATAELTDRPWGTEVRLRLEHVPPGKRTCHLLVQGRNGMSEVAGRWSVGYSGATEIPGSTSVRIGDIDSLAVIANDGTLVDISSQG